MFIGIGADRGTNYGICAADMKTAVSRTTVWKVLLRYFAYSQTVIFLKLIHPTENAVDHAPFVGAYNVLDDFGVCVGCVVRAVCVDVAAKWGLAIYRAHHHERKEKYQPEHFSC